MLVVAKNSITVDAGLGILGNAIKMAPEPIID
jgi:hypothetical protein